MIQTDLYSFSYKKGSLVPWCKKCSADVFYLAGKTSKGFQRYRCKSCGHRFTWTSDLSRRTLFSNVIAFATELYTTVGISLRKVAYHLKKYFDITVSHECIRQWVKIAKETVFPDEKITSTATWHADETYIKIKGIGHWLWIVRCRESGHVIAWHLSKTHLLKDAKAVMQKALEVSNGVRPERIITDGLWQYPVAIYKVMGWTWKEQKKHHVQDSGIGKNAFIERLNREIKRRVKWFSTFQALQSAQAFFGLWFYHHNSLKLT